MPGVTKSEVLRFFFDARARRARPPSPAQERLNQAVLARALRERGALRAIERIEHAAELHGWEVAREG